jgi:HSP20 family protein
MTLNRWDPVRDLLDFQEKVNRLVHCRGERPRSHQPCWCPLVDVVETPDAYIFRAELPGIGRENISVEAEGGRLRISGRRPLDSEPHCAAYHTMERPHGGFERCFNLPPDADVGSAQARYVDGVLEISLPKSQAQREHSLTVVRLRG